MTYCPPLQRVACAAGLIAALLAWSPARAEPGTSSAPTSVPASAPTTAPTTAPASLPATRPAERGPSAREGANTYEPQQRLPPPSAPPGVRRPRPRYGGNPAPPATLAEVLVWLPRGLLFPLYLLSEYLIRRPLVALLTLGEKYYVLEWLQWLFLWQNNNAGLVPTAFLDFGLNPSVGFWFFYNDLFGARERTTLSGAFWGEKWVSTRLTQRFFFFEGEATYFELSGGFLTRPDQPYYGIGRATEQADELFYRPVIGSAKLRFSGAFSQLNRLSSELEYRHASFRGGQRPSVARLLDEDASTGELGRIIPGFGDYNLLSVRAQLDLDTRHADPLLTPGTGARLELFGSFNVDPAEPELSFFTWGYTAGLFWDFSGYHHVIAVRLYMAFLEALGGQTVPFYELPALGGPQLMRGFFERRFIGESVLDLTLEYRYPVWAILDGTVFVGLGNAFDGHLADFAFDDLFLNWGFGLRSSTDRYTSFEILLAFGTNRLDSRDLDPAASIRFVFGVNFGF